MYTHSLLLHRGSLQSGEATVLTDAFALGVTVLMALTGLPSANIRQRCRHMQKWPTQPSRWQAPGVPDVDAGSCDEAVVISLAEIVTGLKEEWEEDRMPLSEVLERLEAMAPASTGEVASEAMGIAKTMLRSSAAAFTPGGKVHQTSGLSKNET